ncbi:MAG TPA: hypothetical protein H9769_09355 [Candidatus Microbacterium pullistercoris]|nr:hypothetical protein [Candidatus Microbacterium pullistercoris]
MTRRTLAWIVIALVVLIIELGATIGSTTGESFSPVDGWGETRHADTLTFVIVVVGCGTLAFFDRFPRTVAIISTASYLVFALRDHELGMFLPPMVVIFGLAAHGGRRFAAISFAVASLAAGLVWVASRAGTVEEPGVALLAWVAFGSVLAAFFCVPLLIGEIVRARSMLHDARSAAAG